jgi:hypothetical protein
MRPSNLRVRAPRIPIDLEVSSKTIGTGMAYNLQTLDISRSGMLLSFESSAKMPFNINTLIEMTIDPERRCLGLPVMCLGKVVRRESEKTSRNRESTRIGVQIVQIDASDLTSWEGCLNELEKKFGIETNNKIGQQLQSA